MRRLRHLSVVPYPPCGGASQLGPLDERAIDDAIPHEPRNDTPGFLVPVQGDRGRG
jgi:hypothetical protein